MDEKLAAYTPPPAPEPAVSDSYHGEKPRLSASPPTYPSSSTSVRTGDLDALDHAENGGGHPDTILPARLDRIATQLSTQDPPLNLNLVADSDEEDDIYNRFPTWRKLTIVAFVSYCSFLSPISSTAVLSATPEVAATYHTTGTVVNVSNALYLFAMGVCPLIWAPMSQVYGRRAITIVTALLFLGCSVGTALAPNLAAFFVFRILTALQGTSFLVIGSACIGDIYRPTERATAIGWFFCGAQVGPSLGPLIGGVVVQFTSWRVLFWVQTGLAAAAALGAVLLLPETIHRKKSLDLKELSGAQKARAIARMVSPWNVLRHYCRARNVSLLCVAAASSALVWNMYALLTPIRYVLNPRFGLDDSPLLGALFFLAPGAGYVLGSFFGGRFADGVVRAYIGKRGRRVPEDRLRAAVPFMGVVIPACIVVYGWSVEKAVGGIPVPVIMMFVQGVAQLFSFPALNTYCLDVMQKDGAEVMAGNFMIRYWFGCAGSAVALPAIQKIGVGGFSTISAGFMVVTAGLLCVAIRWGEGWMRKGEEEPSDGMDGEETR